MKRIIAVLTFVVATVLLSTGTSSATPGAAQVEAQPGPSGNVGVLGGCDWTGCGMVVNSTGRGFYVTLLWGGPWNDTNVKWVPAWSSYGGNGIDVDGILVASGCVMSGVINGRVPGYNYPFVWTSDWHKIWTNETAFVTAYTC